MSFNTSFVERLNEAFLYAGILDPHDQLEKIADACKVTVRTAKKYRLGQARPNFYIVHLAVALGVDALWLHDGTGMSPQMQEVIDNMRLMTKTERSQFARMAIRLLNNDRKVLRLIEMRDKGQISRHQFLSMM